jgi:hypothetical protein
MKYIVNRNEFLRDTKRLSSTDFLREYKSDKQEYEYIIESAAPFSNDATWNGSLIGRLINHIIRKAKIVLDMIRIKPVLRNLRGEFERISADGLIIAAGDESKDAAMRLIVSEVLGALLVCIEEGQKVFYIKSLNEEAIKKVSESKLDAKDDILKELEELKNFLEPLDGDEGKEDESFIEKEKSDEEDQEDKEDDKEEGKKEDDGVLIGQEVKELEKLYPIMMENLKALLGIMNSLQPASPQTGVGNSMNVKYAVRKGDTLAKIQADKNINKKSLSIDDIKKKNPSISKLTDTDELTAMNISQLVLETAAPSKVEQAKTSLKTSLNVLMSKDKDISIGPDFIRTLINKSNKTGGEDDNSHLIISLYNQINVFLKGDKKQTIQEPTPLYKEGYDFLMAKTSTNKEGGKIFAAAEKMARFIKRVLQFDGKNLYGAMGQLGISLQKFVETIKQCMAAPIVKGMSNNKMDSPKKNEGSLLGYSDFIMLFEADNDDDEYGDFDPDDEDEGNDPGTEKSQKGEPAPVPTGSTSEKIKDFFDKTCKTTRKYILDKTESEKIKDNLERLKDSKEVKEGFVIDGLDPIIQIIRLFNRAYKIYTVQTITKRPDGKVDPSTYSEYTSFGGRSSGGELNGWSGPYRNNKIFNQWEDGVLKIMGDAEFSYIFTPKTKLRMPLVPNPSKAEDWEMREGAGAKLRDFMNDMLDGEELYKVSSSSTEKGAQAKFLEKYFGKVSEKEISSSFAITDEEGNDNSEAATAISSSSLNIKFMDSSKITPVPNLTKGNFIAVKCRTIDNNGKVSEKTKDRYFFVAGNKNNRFCLAMCNSFYYFKDIIKDAPNEDKMDGRKKVIEKGDLPGTLVDSTSFRDENTRQTLRYQMKYTSTNSPQIFTKGSTIEIIYIKGDNQRAVESEKIRIESVHWLIYGEKKPYSPDIDIDHMKKKIGAYGEWFNKPDIVSYVTTANNTNIKK